VGIQKQDIFISLLREKIERRWGKKGKMLHLPAKREKMEIKEEEGVGKMRARCCNFTLKERR